ncbi:PREDICTED: uncharacterized protein LOC106106989 [Papilio polytes]|uniref:uncharacterized protein LOC106106989 n=1 Tax=Papilio polytes TaxID=76194 RepID=UPI0006767CB6|nr:PREDICTED: uncharacterized protein LOC106106989 [Papilio polytes]
MCTVEGNWNYEFDILNIEKSNFTNFEIIMKNFQECALKTFENTFTADNHTSKDITQKSDDDLRDLIEKNKTLKQEIDIKLKELQQQQKQYETFKQDQKLLIQEIKEKHEAFLMAKKYYKKFLKMYFTIESKKDNSQTIFIQFFTEARKDSGKYSVRLQRDISKCKYELLSTNPQLKNFKELQRKLQETNDVPGVLSCIRKSFLTIKDSIKG